MKFKTFNFDAQGNQISFLNSFQDAALSLSNFLLKSKIFFLCNEVTKLD